MKTQILLVMMVGLLAGTVNADVVDQALAQYRVQGSTAFSADAGRALWDKSYPDARGGEVRRCATCHGADLSQPGKHAQTGKRIEAMASSVNPKRYTDLKFIEKWFLRNCKWTVGRECTAQEKGDVLTYLRGL